MDAFLRLAKGLSPANANRDADKVFYNLTVHCCSCNIQPFHLMPFTCDDLDHRAFIFFTQCIVITEAALLFCRAMIKIKEGRVAVTHG